jgi:hypothetical protein
MIENFILSGLHIFLELYLFSKNSGKVQLNGQFINDQNAPVGPTYHVAELVRFDQPVGLDPTDPVPPVDAVFA